MSSPLGDKPYGEEKTAVVHGRRMAYVEQGTGNPIVFQHGNPTSSYLWRNIMPHLEGLGRLIACDLIGMGDSDKLEPSGPDRYTYEEERDYLFALWEQLDIDHDVVLVIHNWGSVLGFDWANQHRDRVAGIAYMEAIVTPFTWDDFASPEPTRRQAFEDLRSPAGEQMVLENNFFVENRIPNGILRQLSAEEMDTYRRPFANPGEDRRPTLTLPRQLPIDGHPANVVEIVDDYGRWLARSDVPKLFIKAEPGGLLTGRPREFCRTWPNRTEVTVAGKHFVQEDSPHQIGQAVRAFVEGLHRSSRASATRSGAGQTASPGVKAATVTAESVMTDWTFGGLWPFEPRWFESSDGRMHYVDQGPRDGRPVVLVHGNPTWGFLYRDFIGPLTEAGHRAIVPDHLGFGRSDKPSDPELYRIPRHIARLDALLESLDLRDAVVVVQDWGGPIGLSWAVAHPERVSGLFILNTFDGPQQTLPVPLRLFRTPGVGEVLVQGFDMFVRGFLFREGVVHRDRLTEDVRRAYLAPHPTWSSRTGELVFPREIPDPASPTGPVAELLTQLERELEQHFRSKPARIVWPMRDPAFTPAVLEDWRKTLPDAPVTQLDDASHYIQEDAHERIVPQLLSLVADTT